MKKIFRNKVLSGVLIMTLAIFAFALTLNRAEAGVASCTATVSGNWNVVGTWGCGHVPLASEQVFIPGNVVVTVNAAGAVAFSVTINDPIATGDNGITIVSPGTLTVTNDVTITGSTGASNSTVAVGSGTLSAASITVNGGAVGNSVVSVSTGTVTTSGDIIALGVAAAAQLTSTGAGNINIGGNLTGVTLTTSGTGTITFNGALAQTVGSYTTYNNVVINKSAGVASLLAVNPTTIGGTLTVTNGTLDMAGSTATVTGATSMASGGTLLFSSATGAKTFTGNVTVNAGGIWNETAATAPTFAGSLANNGTFTASTGVHTFGSGTISGGNALSIPSVSVTGNSVNANTLTAGTLLTVAGTLTNNGTLGATTALSGAGTLNNGAAGTLNIGGTSGITTLTATAAGNTVNYTSAGAQTVHAGPYYNLTLSGGGTKALTSAQTIAGSTIISGASKADLTGNSTTNTLTFGGIGQSAGTYGSTGSGAQNINPVFFAGPGMITVALGSAPLDTTPPTNTSVTINGGAATTSSLSVTLTLTATDAIEMQISNDAGFAGAVWGELFATTKAWTLTAGDGLKTVYARFRDAAGNVSAAVSDTITVSGSGTNPAPAGAHPNGTLIISNGTVFLMQGGTRIGFRDPQEYMSHGYNFNQVVTANATDMSLPQSSFVRKALEGTLVLDTSDNITVYMTGLNGTKRGFTTAAVFNGLGYSFVNLFRINMTDYPPGLPIADATLPHPEGALVLNSGTVWWVLGNMRQGFESTAVFNTYGFSFSKVVPANSADMALPVGPLVKFRDGTLVYDNSSYFIISDGTKRMFVSAADLTARGYKTSNAISASLATYTSGPNVQ